MEWLKWTLTCILVIQEPRQSWEWRLVVLAGHWQTDGRGRGLVRHEYLYWDKRYHTPSMQLVATESRQVAWPLCGVSSEAETVSESLCFKTCQLMLTLQDFMPPFFILSVSMCEVWLACTRGVARNAIGGGGGTTGVWGVRPPRRRWSGGSPLGKFCKFEWFQTLFQTTFESINFIKVYIKG